MTLIQFLATNTLLTNLYGFIDYSFFRARFLTRFGFRQMRKDLTAQQICEYAQNVVDINVDYLRHVITETFNPFQTWSETGTDTSNNHTESETNGENNKTTKHSGTILNESAGNSQSNDKSVSNDNSNSAVNPYNSAEALPTNNSSSIAKSEGTAKTSNRAENKQTLNTTDTDISGSKTSVNSATSGNGTYSKSGYRYDESQEIINNYISGYDIIINMIYPIILETVVEWSGII